MTPAEVALLQAQVDHMQGDPWLGAALVLGMLLVIVFAWSEAGE